MLWSEKINGNVIGETESSQWYVRPYYWAGVYRKGKLRIGNNLGLFATREAAIQFARSYVISWPVKLLPAV